MKSREKQFYLVDFQVLPEAIKKTIRIKEIIKSGKVKTINEAIVAMDISRSAYYKYKDHVEPAADASKERGVTFFIMMQNDFSLLNKIIRKIEKDNNKMLSVNSGGALEKDIPVTISVQTKMSFEGIHIVGDSIKRIKGVKQVIISEEAGG